MFLFIYVVIFKFKSFILVHLIKSVTVIPAKSYFGEPRCTIHLDIYHTVPVLVTAVFLKMSLGVRNMCM
jgi:hypothetical protein